MELDRRRLMQSTAVLPVAFGVTGMAGGALFTCGPSGVQVDPAVLDQIMKAVASSCNFIPAATTIVGLIAATFPALVGATTIAVSVLAEIKAILCAAAPAIPSAGAAALAPKKIVGTAVDAHGWVIQDGKLVYV